MSQMTSFWKAVKACWKLRVLVKMVTVTARNAQAPVGKGSNTSPAGQALPSRHDSSAQYHCAMQPHNREAQPSMRRCMLLILACINRKQSCACCCAA